MAQTSSPCPSCHLRSLKNGGIISRPSPYEALLGSVISPESPESFKQSIDALIHEARMELSQYDSIIRDLVSIVIIEAESQRDKVQQFINAHVSLNPPVHALPPEILNEIFLRACMSPYRVFGSRNCEARMIGGVCRRWRAAAWSSPALWSSLNLTWKPGWDQGVGIKLLGDTLERSLQSKLSVKLRTSSQMPRPIVESLVRHSSRWDALCLDVPSGDYDFWTGPPLHLPSLTSLDLGSATYDSITTALKAFKDAPNLKSLTFELFWYGYSHAHPASLGQWPQVTHLVMSTGKGWEDILISIHILRHFLNVEVLEDGTVEDACSTTFSPPLTLSKLRSLTVRSPRLLPFLTCPSLEHMSFAGYQHDFPGVLFSQFIARSGCQLQSLETQDMARVLSNPVQVFSSVPSLKKLVLFMVDLYCGGEPDEIFECLSSTGSDMLLPELTVLDLKMYTFFPGQSQKSDSALVAMIDNRWNGSPAGSGPCRVILRCCEAGIGPRDDPEDEIGEDERATRNAMALSHIDRLKTLKREGLDISIILEEAYEGVERGVFL
ncbi:uncharacterized protein ARMOST_14977 [Armillaria ostoyae]|uniref:Uncharacterized protein n=1 Tax=Armillaria ostoyae TaxID=47428 RepID=A0A284RS36_ARMOS|nr:uncharacterized protein ARMOST_14977 [Armillaria ostoyae]